MGRWITPTGHSAHRCPRGFTLVEVLIAAFIVALLIGLLLAVVVRVRGAQRGVKCIATLRSIATAFHAYTHDNRGHFPHPGFANRSWEQMLLRYHRGPFQCEADGELYPAVGSSYDWRDTGRPATTLAGKSVAEITHTDAVLVFEALPGWHARRKINAARVDGSATTLDDEACFADLQRPVGNLSDPESR